jgi:hydroxyacylglutathione hydrolase
MQVTERIHALKIPFKIPVTSDVMLERFVYSYLIFGRKIYLIDTGVAGAEKIIYEYIDARGRNPAEITSIVLTHTHPDHIGSVMSIKEFSNCRVYVHEAETAWLEDIQLQCEQRPVPGFFNLVAGSTSVDQVLRDGRILELDEEIKVKIIHTPGHSKGSVSIYWEDESALFTGDVLISPEDMPIYEDIAALAASVRRLQKLSNVSTLLSSWEEPVTGTENVKKRIDMTLRYLKRIHNIVCSLGNDRQAEPMELCRQVVGELGLPPAAVSPLVAKGFTSSLAICPKTL